MKHLDSGGIATPHAASGRHPPTADCSRWQFDARGRLWLLAVVLALTSSVSVAQTGFDHRLWDGLLREHVVQIRGGVATAVDYAGFAREREQLRVYLEQLAAVSRPTFDAWPVPDQLAFLINTYNAWTVELILTGYPTIDSIRDLGSFFSSPWSKDFVSLFGGKVTLDTIEHSMIRGWDRYQEPRIHFAVNCAAIGCPALRAEAYTGERLAEQLDDSTRRFLSDRTRNYVDGSRLYLSKIFDWYEEDFERGWQGIDSLAEFLLPYADALGLDNQARSALAQGRLSVRYLRYDWGLNRTP